MKKILIIDQMHDSILTMLDEKNCNVSYVPDWGREQILEGLDGVEGIFVRSKTSIDRQVIDLAPDLKFIARAGAGLEKMDVDYLTEKKVAIVNAPEGNRDSLGEHTVGVLLSLLHKLHTADREVRSRVWDREGNRGMELGGKTVGIFGYGFMGSAFAQKLQGFGCRLIAYDKYKIGFGGGGIQEVSLDQFKAETEILSIHVPLTPETNGLFDRSFLEEFPKLKVLINTARGGVLSNETVINLLESGKILGAGLDVLENEKLGTMDTKQEAEFDYLAKSDQVMLTPHVGGWSHESYQRINEVLVGKLVDLKLI